MGESKYVFSIIQSFCKNVMDKNVKISFEIVPEVFLQKLQTTEREDYQSFPGFFINSIYK